jgi:hypothetical protein
MSKMKKNVTECVIMDGILGRSCDYSEMWPQVPRLLISSKPVVKGYIWNKTFCAEIRLLQRRLERIPNMQ